MFRFNTMTAVILMKSGKTIKLKGCSAIDFKSNENGFTYYKINGGGSFDLLLKEIEAVQIIHPLWMRIWGFIIN